MFHVAAERMVCRLRTRVFRHLLSQEIGFFDEHVSADLTTRYVAAVCVCVCVWAVLSVHLLVFGVSVCFPGGWFAGVHVRVLVLFARACARILTCNPMRHKSSERRDGAKGCQCARRIHGRAVGRQGDR